MSEGLYSEMKSLSLVLFLISLIYSGVDLEKVKPAAPVFMRKSLFGSRHTVNEVGTPGLVFNRTRKGKSCVHRICKNMDDYPSEEILATMKKSDKYDDYFKEKKLPVKISGPDKEQTMCKSASHTIFPKTAVSTDKVERVIVNVEGYSQALVLETCIETGKCSFSEMFPANYVTRCKQKFTIRKLMTLDEAKNPAYDYFKVPSSCVCTVKMM